MKGVKKGARLGLDYSKGFLTSTLKLATSAGGKVKIIAAIKKPEVIKKILDHIGKPSVPPEIASARGPPIFYDEEFNHDSNLLSDNLLS